MSNTLQILEGLDNVPKKIQKQMIKNTLLSLERILILQNKYVLE
jgi:hypothetical protein